MANKLPMLSAEIEAFVSQPPPHPEMWLVLAYWPKGKWWALKGDSGGDPSFRRAAFAEELAEKLVAAGWIHVRLVRIPGWVSKENT